MSIGEVEQVIATRLKHQQEQTKSQATMLWKLGDLIAFAAHDPKHYPPLHEAFPGLFQPPPGAADGLARDKGPYGILQCREKCENEGW